MCRSYVVVENLRDLVTSVTPKSPIRISLSNSAYILNVEAVRQEYCIYLQKQSSACSNQEQIVSFDYKERSVPRPLYQFSSVKNGMNFVSNKWR